MFKKVLTFFITVFMLFGLSTTAFATSVDNVNPTNTSDVKATYVKGSISDTVYSVDVVWGNMEFTYTSPAEGTWKPSTHTYDGAETKGIWSCDDKANEIKIVNHSNTVVKASVTYNKGNDYQEINGIFGKNTLSTPTAVGTKYDSAPTDFTTLNLNGSLKESAQQVTVGTVTLRLDTE